MSKFIDSIFRKMGCNRRTVPSDERRGRNGQTVFRSSASVAYDRLVGELGLQDKVKRHIESHGTHGYVGPTGGNGYDPNDGGEQP